MNDRPLHRQIHESPYLSWLLWTGGLSIITGIAAFLLPGNMGFPFDLLFGSLSYLMGLIFISTGWGYSCSKWRVVGVSFISSKLLTLLFYVSLYVTFSLNLVDPVKHWDLIGDFLTCCKYWFNGLITAIVFTSLLGWYDMLRCSKFSLKPQPQIPQTRCSFAKSKRFNSPGVTGPQSMNMS